MGMKQEEDPIFYQYKGEDLFMLTQNSEIKT